MKAALASAVLLTTVRCSKKNASSNKTPNTPAEKRACPEGTERRTERTQIGTTIGCQRADGTGHGPFADFDSKGAKRMDGEYRDGTVHGTLYLFAAGMLLSQGQVQKGQRQGIWRDYLDGKVLDEVVYKNDKPVSQRSWPEGKPGSKAPDVSVLMTRTAAIVNLDPNRYQAEDLADLDNEDLADLDNEDLDNEDMADLDNEDLAHEEDLDYEDLDE